jgi:hypothetical protein
MPLIKFFKVKFILWLSFMNWLQNHLITCPFKYLTGIDCPGCGFQRSVLALIQGDLQKSFALYPPAIPLLLFFAYGIADKYFKLDTLRFPIRRSLFMLVGSIVLVSYAVKLWHMCSYHKLSV